ncbi:hypothetical protein ACYSNR_09105 [Enterococcus sp. LJL128]
MAFLEAKGGDEKMNRQWFLTVFLMLMLFLLNPVSAVASENKSKVGITIYQEGTSDSAEQSSEIKTAENQGQRVFPKANEVVQMQYVLLGAGLLLLAGGIERWRNQGEV